MCDDTTPPPAPGRTILWRQGVSGAIFTAALCFGLLAITSSSAGSCLTNVSATAEGRQTRIASALIEQTTLAGVPVILRIPQTIRKPPILLWHGLGPPASESELMHDLPLDDVPAMKVYMGLPLFGARAPSPGEESVASRQAEDYARRLFDPVVMGAANELPKVLNALRHLHCLRSAEKVGLFGFSAGGTAVLVALSEASSPIGAAVTVNAPVSLNDALDALERATKHPYAWSDASRQLAQRSDAVSHAADVASGDPPRALLLFQGAEDDVISRGGAATLDEALRPYYARSGNERRLKLVIATGVSHNWADPSTIAQLQTSVAAWFNRYL